MTTDEAQGTAAPPPAGRSWRRILVRVLLAAVALFSVIQLVPYGRSHSNPPVTAEPAWNAPATVCSSGRS